MPSTKIFYPRATQEDIEDLKKDLMMVRRLYYKGKWPNAQETIKTIQELIKIKKEQFAKGEGDWVESFNEDSNDGQGNENQNLGFWGQVFATCARLGVPTGYRGNKPTSFWTNRNGDRIFKLFAEVNDTE